MITPVTASRSRFGASARQGGNAHPLGPRQRAPRVQRNLAGHDPLKLRPGHGQPYKHTVIVVRRDAQLDVADVVVHPAPNMKDARGRRRVPHHVAEEVCEGAAPLHWVGDQIERAAQECVKLVDSHV